MVIVCAFLYTRFESISINQIYQANTRSLSHCSNEVYIMSSTALTISNQIRNDISMTALLYYSNPDIYSLTTAISQLQNYKLTMPFIDSIYIYNGETKTYYIEGDSWSSSPQGEGQSYVTPRSAMNDQQINKIIDHRNDYMPYIPIPRTCVGADGTTRNYYTFLEYSTIGNDQSSVVVNITEDWINSILTTENDEPGSETFIIDGKGNAVSQSESIKMMQNLSDKPYIQRVLRNNLLGGYFIGRVNGKKSLVVYTAADSYGWQYVRVIGWNTIFHSVESIRRTTIAIGLAILLLGGILSFFLSKRLYVPIWHYINSLEFEKRKNRNEQKQKLLQRLVLEKDAGSCNRLKAELRDYGLSFSENRNRCLLLLTIDRYHAFESEKDLADRNLYKFGICNIASEILSDFWKTETVDMSPSVVMLILESENTGAPDLEHSTEGRIRRIQAEVKNIYDLSISVFVSKIDRMEHLYETYQRTQDLSLLRLFYGQMCLLYCDQIAFSNPSDFSYPQQKEKQLVDSLMAGRTENSKKLYYEIISETFTYPISVYALTIFHLIFTVNNTVNLIAANNHILHGPELSISTVAVNESETIEEVHRQFYELFDRLHEQMENKKTENQKALVEGADRIIGSEYANPDLSVEYISEALNVSSGHLSRVYKQSTARTVGEKITEVRMKAAKVLLQSTGLSIMEISAKVGYLNDSYFYKAFKQLGGVTPNEYRKTEKTNGKRHGQKPGA